MEGLAKCLEPGWGLESGAVDLVDEDGFSCRQTSRKIVIVADRLLQVMGQTP